MSKKKQSRQPIWKDVTNNNGMYGVVRKPSGAKRMRSRVSSRAHPALRVGEHAALVAAVDDLAADLLAGRARHDAAVIRAELERVVEGDAEHDCGRQGGTHGQVSEAGHHGD